ncbi:MAG: S8 family serine peptidase [Deltaproteobacteria bacterium]|nr:S8 family serine peptidase [Deltaproteobacteria bacterium]
MKKSTLVFLLLSVLMLNVAVQVDAKKPLDPLDEIKAAVADGGGKLYFVPEVKTIPLNFADYPEAFDTGIAAWNNDMIDTEKVAGGINGEGVYVAVLDTGLKSNYRDYFPEERIATEWGRSFIDKGVMQDEKAGKYTPNVVESSSFTGEHPHGTHVASTVIGYSFYGLPVPGVAPHATIIPVKVLEYYNGLKATFGTDAAVAAGIEYVAGLAEENPGSRFVINMSLGALEPITAVEAAAIDDAIEAGVIVVAAAGNEGTGGMDSPGSYAPVISVGATGWAFDPYTCSGEWVIYTDDCYLSSGWWDEDVPEEVSDAVSYITDFSARVRLDLWDQELDLAAPGSWVVGPYPTGTGQSHLPWWANGNGYGVDGQYYFVGGTSMATPHVAGVAALMLQANPTLTQADVETILRSTADPLPFASAKDVADPVYGLIVVEWGGDGLDAVGAGLVQADAAVDDVLP